MSRDTAYLLDILDSSRLAIRHLGNSTREQFFSDIEKQDAVIRRLSIIGEAARRISDETRNRYPNLPWTDMIAMRNLVIHEYDDVDMGIVWDTVRNDLPPILAGLESLSESLPE
jgi:uncharacterized protein with HEPN domain